MKRVQTPFTVVVPAGRVCPRCGAPLGGFGPEGLCGACMFDVALLADEPVAELDLLASGPRRFGDYELLEEIARGGMGVVFKARQLSLNRIVALKMILRGEFAGVAELARFRAEAETAARLQHPNIVAIHEVGEREGQPFFVMDYVAGQNLAQLVSNTPLPAARAAKYVKTIAEAVQYAHQQGVLHRDLKPSNVLIDANDQPRVTDFGLAKRLEGDASLTVTGQLLGSPNFMPPEQAAGNSKAIGPASDVYSLGAILYHALTGRPPFVAESVPATLRLVAESEPVSPRLLNGGVPRDLETICLKCLQKEAQKRYHAAQELADELNRFLRDEPIHAHPATPVEKLWRWSRRNRALATTLGATVALLLIVAIGSPIAAFRINRERRDAEAARQNETELRKQAEANEKKATTEAVKSEQVAQFLQDMLKGVAPSVARGRDTTMLKEILDKTSERIGKDLTDQPEVALKLWIVIGGVYGAIGQNAKATNMFHQALDMSRKLQGSNELDKAELLESLGYALRTAVVDYGGDRKLFPEAEAMLRAALAIKQRLLGNEDAAVADTLHALGYVLYWEGKRAEAETLNRDVLARRRKLFGDESLPVAESMNNLAFMVLDPRETETLLLESLAIQRRLIGTNKLDDAAPLQNLGGLYERQGRLAEAENAYRESLATRRALLGDEHTVTHMVLRALAGVLEKEKKWGELELLLIELLAMQRKLLGPDSQELIVTLGWLAGTLDKEGKSVEAEPLIRERLAKQRKLLGDEHREALDTWGWLVAVLDKNGKPAEAERLVREGIALARSGQTNDPAQRREGLVAFADKLAEIQKFTEAEQILNELLTPELEARAEGAKPLRHRAHVFARQGRWQEAGVDLAKALKLGSFENETRYDLCMLCLQTGDVESYRTNCLAILAKFGDTKDPRVARLAVKACLLLPLAEVNLVAVGRLAETALAEKGVWREFVKGLAQYRQSHLAGAEEWMIKALARPESNERDAEASMILAMAKYHLGRADEARAVLAKGVEIVESKLPKLDRGDLGGGWPDWIMSRVLMREAKTLIEPAAGGETGPAKTRD